MKDLRKSKSSLLSRVASFGHETGKDKVREMLAFLNMNLEDEIAEEAIGYLSSHAMELNMINLENFLNNRSKTIKDLRN